jgi:hypothetical protein
MSPSVTATNCSWRDVLQVEAFLAELLVFTLHVHSSRQDIKLEDFMKLGLVRCAIHCLVRDCG